MRKDVAPGSLLAHIKAAALIREIEGKGVGVGSEGAVFGVDKVVEHPEDVGIGVGSSSKCGRKVILPNIQSINGL